MLTVMIVDDMDFDRLDIRRLKLWGEKSGFTIVEEAKNGHEALSKLEMNPVDLIITDIKMPKVDGIELLEKIMVQNLCPCVVLLSDYSDFNYVRRGLVLGAFDYLKKPINENEFDNLLARTRNFILEKRKEAERVRRLEEKADTYVPKADVNHIIECIKNGDFGAINAADHIVNVLRVNSNNDIFKAETILKSIILEITEAIFKKYEWINKFLSASELKNMNFTDCNTIEGLGTVFIRNISTITSAVYMLNYSNTGNEAVNQICNYVLNNVDDGISLGIVAHNTFMNKTYISELFKQKTGIGFIEYITTVKMERAKRLLKEGNFKIYEIGEKLGYKDIEYFSRQFKKYSGCTPIEYRQNNTNKDK